MMRIVRNERGMALALAIVALVVTGALIAGAFFAGTQEQRVGENSRRSYQSFGIAEAGANEVIRTWDPIKYNQRRAYPGDWWLTDRSSRRPGRGATGATSTS